MASRRNKRRRRPAFPWAFTWFLVFGCIVIYGYHNSKLTAITTVQARGVPEYDKNRIERIVSTMRGIPSAKVPTEKIEELVEANFAIKRASLSTNVFGRASLAVEPRQAIALFDDSGTALDDQGTTYPFRGGNRPRITVTKKVQDYAPILSLCDPSRYRQMAAIAKKLQLLMPKLAGKVAPDERRGLCLYTGELTVEFGDVRDLDKKLEILAQKLSDEPALVESRARINLIDPNDPMIDRIQ